MYFAATLNVSRPCPRVVISKLPASRSPVSPIALVSVASKVRSWIRSAPCQYATMASRPATTVRPGGRSTASSV